VIVSFSINCSNETINKRLNDSMKLRHLGIDANGLSGVVWVGDDLIIVEG
jgi:hypothetical protein